MKLLSVLVCAFAIITGTASVASADPGGGNQQFTLPGSCDGVGVTLVVRKGLWSPFAVASSDDAAAIPVGAEIVPVSLEYTVTTPNGEFSFSGEKPGHANSELTGCSFGGSLFDGVTFEAEALGLLQP